MPFYAELNHPNASYCYSVSNKKYDDFQIHCHNTYEIYYLQEGDVDILIEGKQYHPAPDSVILLSANVLHGIRINSESDCKRFTLHFNPHILNAENRDVLLAAFPDATSRKEVYYEQPQAFHLRTFLNAMADCSKQPEEISGRLFPIYVAAFLAQLTLMCRTLHPTERITTVSPVILNIITYLNEHLAERITLDDLAERFFISKHYLNRAFRKATGTTVLDYLIYKRIIYAKQLIISGVPATEAAFRSGFGDYSAFFRAYKKVLGHSPKDDV